MGLAESEIHSHVQLRIKDFTAVSSEMVVMATAARDKLALYLSYLYFNFPFWLKQWPYLHLKLNILFIATLATFAPI